MPEPLEQVVAAITGRRGQIRPWEQNAFLGDTGMRSQAISDAAQGVDISSAAPNTRLRARQGEMPQPAEEEAPAPKEQEARNPFQFASMKGVPQEDESPCANGQCPPRGQTLNPFIPMQQQAMPMAAPARQLPPGVVLGPGEELDWNSIREVPTASAPQATTAAASPAAQAASPAPATAAGQTQKSARTPFTMPQEFYAAEQHLQAARSAATPRDALIYLQLAKQSNMIGETSLGMQRLESLRTEADTMEERLSAAANRRNELLNKQIEGSLTETRIKAGYPDIDAFEKIRTGPGTPMQKATMIVRTTMQVQNNIVMSDEQRNQLYDQEFGQITARDAAKALPSVVDAMRVRAEGGTPDQQQQAAEVRTVWRRTLHDRYGSIKDPAQRGIQMGNELRPVFTDKFTQMHLKAGMSPDKAEEQAVHDANSWVNQSIAAVEAENDRGRAIPAAPPMGSQRLPQQQAPQQTAPEPAPEKSGQGRGSWMDSLIMEPQAWR